MINKIKLKWLSFFYAQCYAYCKTNEYLASHRGEAAVSADWALRASQWHLLWWQTGRGLR